jgi:hypothetical protein
MITDQNSQIIY